MRFFRYGILSGGLALLLALSLTGCNGQGRDELDDYTGGEGAKVGENTAKGPKTPLKASPGTTLVGRVILDGQVNVSAEEQKFQKFVNSTVGPDRGCCLAGAPLNDKVQQKWRLADDGQGVANVLVWLKPADTTSFVLDPTDEGIQKVKGEEVEMNQPFCAFEPHVVALFPQYKNAKDQVVKTEQKFRIKSTAKCAHNSNISGGGIKLNQAVPQVGIVVDFKPSAEPIRVSCDIHKWMNAYILVTDNPYYAITDKDGNFTIKNVPVGKVKLFAWHEGAVNKYLTTQQGEERDLTAGENKMDLKLIPE